jgi:hypothetical protein
MTTSQPLTPAEIRLAQYGQRTSTWSTATYNGGTEKALHEIALGLKAELDRVRDQLTAVTALCDEQDMAARLFELPTPEWIVAVRRAIEDPAAASAAARP